MAKQQAISALDIIPGKVYAIRQNSSIEPVEVVCTESHGYLRGFVDLHDYGTFGNSYTAKATIKKLSTGNTYTITVSRYSNDTAWKFCVPWEITLLELPPAKVEVLASRIHEEIKTHQKIIDTLQARLNILNTLK